MVIRMTEKEVMTTPKLSDKDYSDLVEAFNRRVHRGGVMEPCGKHYWVRLPHDVDSEPAMVCLVCMRTMSPVVTPAR